MTDARPTKADLLFGQLGLKTGVLEKRHLQEGLAKQDIPGENRPLGQILIDLGHITPEGVDQIIAAQKELLTKKRSRSKAEKEDNLFGKVAIRLGFCTGEQVSEALDTQENLPANRFMRLGDIMVIKGYLTPENIQKILDTQKGLIMYCERCDTQYNVLLFKPGARPFGIELCSGFQIPFGLNMHALLMGFVEKSTRFCQPYGIGIGFGQAFSKDGQKLFTLPPPIQNPPCLHQ